MIVVRLKERLATRQCLTEGDVRQTSTGQYPGRTAPLWEGYVPYRQLRYLVPDGEFVVSTEGEWPSWFEPTLDTLVELLWLPAGWDSYGALAVDPTHVEAALRVLRLVMREDTPNPSIGPTNRGGVQVEWHERGIDLEFETLSAHRVHVSYEDSTTGADWDREVGADLTPLIECIACLSSR